MIKRYILDTVFDSAGVPSRVRCRDKLGKGSSGKIQWEYETGTPLRYNLPGVPRSGTLLRRNVRTDILNSPEAIVDYYQTGTGRTKEMARV